MPVSSPKRYGWVGLGAMGYPMANQLRRKLPPGSELFVYDVNEEATQRFTHESGGSIPVRIVKNAREVADCSECMISIVPEGYELGFVTLFDSLVDIMTRPPRERGVPDAGNRCFGW
ncbi:hypothetical protein PM082_001245 [Marasmius tenuissimus]|nr:hypothetical protein PM082_001245 [Marasmius tenuissimus]